MKRILFSAHYNCMHDPFKLIGDVRSVQSADDLVPNGVLLLHGGEDISPAIYNQPSNSWCRADDKPSRRDVLEMRLIDRAVKMGLPIVGICRGAQMLCAMDGGSLVQHILGHTAGNGHSIVDTRTNEELHTNSCHHQMMVPNKYNTVVAVDKSRTINAYAEDDKEFHVSVVPEVVHFTKLNALGIQGHPEWVPGTNFQKYCTKLIQDFLYKD